MAKFVYRMQNILDIKNKLEVQARNSYAAARMKLSQEEEKLDRMFEQKVASLNLEAAQKRLGEVMKERKIQEKLREKAYEEFLQELNDQEKKEIDELVSFRFEQEE